MSARPIRFSGILLVAALVLAAIGGPALGFRLHLPFEVYPGAVYIALLAWPALFFSDTTAGGSSDYQFAAYAGPAYTMASKLHLIQPGGTNLKFDGVPWDGEPFKPPIYYGLRVFVWPSDARTGVMADFTHIKAMVRMADTVDQSGMRDGKPVPAHETLSTTFRKLEFTHGYNLLTLNLVRQGAPGARKLLPYAGAGAGVAIPYVEVLRTGKPREVRTSEYQIAGPAFQLLGGVEWRIHSRFSLFVEYKLSCAAIHGKIRTGGSIDTNLCTHQLLAGPAWHLKSARAVTAP